VRYACLTCLTRVWVQAHTSNLAVYAETTEVANILREMLGDIKTRRYVAQCCSVLQCLVACCTAVQRCQDPQETLGNQDLWICRTVLRCVAVCYSVLQCVAACCSMLQCVAKILKEMPGEIKTKLVCAHASCLTVLQYFMIHVSRCCSIAQMKLS